MIGAPGKGGDLVEIGLSQQAALVEHFGADHEGIARECRDAAIGRIGVPRTRAVDRKHLPVALGGPGEEIYELPTSRTKITDAVLRR